MYTIPNISNDRKSFDNTYARIDVQLHKLKDIH